MMNKSKDKKGFSGLSSLASDADGNIEAQKPPAREQTKHPQKSATKPGPAMLLMAAWQGRTEEIKDLLSAGTQLDAKGEDGETPLHLAAFNGQVEVIKVLLNAGAQLDARNDDGWTPLDIAVQNGYAEAVKALRNAGSQPAATNKNEEGQTLPDWVTSLGIIVAVTLASGFMAILLIIMFLLIKFILPVAFIFGTAAVLIFIKVAILIPVKAMVAIFMIIKALVLMIIHAVVFIFNPNSGWAFNP